MEISVLRPNKRFLHVTVDRFWVISYSSLQTRNNYLTQTDSRWSNNCMQFWTDYPPNFILMNTMKFSSFFIVLVSVINHTNCASKPHEEASSLRGSGGKKKTFKASELKSGSVSWAWYGIKLILLTKSEMFRLFKNCWTMPRAWKRFSVLDCLVYGARKKLF